MQTPKVHAPVALRHDSRMHEDVKTPLAQASSESSSARRLRGYLLSRELRDLRDVWTKTATKLGMVKRLVQNTYTAPGYGALCYCLAARIYLHTEFHGKLSNGLQNWEKRKFGPPTADTQHEQEV
jgi:hypothetical protein